MTELRATTEISPTPRRVRKPSWLDPRLVVGAVLVLGSVLLGANVVASADHSEPFIAFSRELAAGTLLSAADVQVVRVQLPARDQSVYVASLATVIGRQLNRPVARGELVPNAALGMAIASTTISVPLAGDAAPPLTPGQRIRLWLSTKSCLSVVVLNEVTVQAVREASATSFSASGGQSVTISVEPALADRVVSALARDGATIRAGLLAGPVDPKANDALGGMDCTPATGRGQ
ncbi:MAG: SAF domain-containing protein [Actinomycetota bacterium]|nr:SAF domain-containing protein [Actinomycetota bacterium]